MSQRVNHRREGKKFQDNGPTWEGGPPNSGCNSTHVARSRRKWRTLGRRAERRTGHRASSVSYQTNGSRQVPQIDHEEIEEYMGQ